MRDAEELPVILSELEGAWKLMEQSLYVIAYLPTTLDDLTWSEVKSSCRPSKHLCNICENIEALSKTSRNWVISWMICYVGKMRSRFVAMAHLSVVALIRVHP